jgi:ribose transport system permease protein
VGDHLHGLGLDHLRPDHGFLLSRTIFGRYVYATGGNPEAARLSGIRGRSAARLRDLGTRSRIAGVLLASRTQSAAANLGTGMELTAISAAVVEARASWVEGAIWRAVLGTLLLAIIGNGFNLLNIDTTYQQIVQGGLILLAVAADQLARRR